MDKKAKEFYIYQHIRLDTNTVFYVGKGKAKRAYEKKNRNPYWKNITNLTPYRVEIVKSNLTEDQAFAAEIKLIAKLRKKKHCEANLTIGGEGVTSTKVSDRRMQEITDLQNLLWDDSINKRFRLSLEELLAQAIACGFTKEANKIKALLKSGNKYGQESN